MKKIIAILCAVMLAGLAQACHAETISDNFNDGNINGWIASAPTSYSGVGNWWIEDNILKQDLPGDHYKFLLNDYTISDQTAETRLLVHDFAGYGGITVWYQNPDNWVDVLIYPASDATMKARVIERIDGAIHESSYPFLCQKETWYKMVVKTNSQTGEIKVFVDDVYLFAHNAITNHRSGLTGLNSGNSGGFFDDFKLISNDIVPEVPSDKEKCKKNGWKLFKNPSFKNQGDCVSYTERNKKIVSKILKPVVAHGCDIIKNNSHNGK